MSARLVVIVVAFALTVGSGCREVDPVNQYSVPTEKSLYEDNHVEPDLPADRETPDQMLGAIVPLGTQIWFFKISGPRAALSAQDQAWKQFVDSLHFSDEPQPQPAWTLPEGWKQKPAETAAPGGMIARFATIQIAEAGGLEMSVTSLPAPRGAPQTAVLMNVNRWRSQLQLPPLSNKFRLQETTRQAEIAATDALPAVRVTLVDLAGRRDPTAGPPMAGRGPTRRPAAGPAGRGPANAGDPGFTYTKPENWQDAPAGGMRRAAFQVSEGGQRVEITVFKLPASGLLANVSRWATQIGLKPLTSEDQLAGVTSDLAVGERVATYVELVGTQAPPQRQVTLAAILPDGELAWFFKLSGKPGTAALALRERAHFRSFVQSVGGPGAARQSASKQRSSRPGPARGAAARPPSRGPAAAADPGFRYTKPAGWQPTPTSSIRRAAFKVSDGDQEVEITVFKLPASGLLPNVSRWAGQIGLKPLTTEAQLAQVVADLAVAGRVAKYVELKGTEQRVTLAAILPDSRERQMAWFFKLSGKSGSAALALREKEHFRSFVQSVQLAPQ